MVVSKRCKICTVIDADNIPISGEYFGKLLPDLIVKISGIELDPRKANGVLICQSCAIQLIHTGTIIDKLRNTLQRLNKLETKSKTPSKNSAASLKVSDGKDYSITNNNNEKQNSNKLQTSENVSQAKRDETKVQNDVVNTKTPKKIVRRKSVLSSEKRTSNETEESKSNGATVNSDNSESVELNTENNAKDLKISNEAKTTPKKIVKCKSVFPDNIDNEETQKSEENVYDEFGKQSGLGETNTQNNITIKVTKKIEHHEHEQLDGDKLESIEQKLQNKTKTPCSAKTVNRKTVVANDKVNHDEEKKQNEQTPKFKKIMDPDVITPVKKTKTKTTKRKIGTSTEESSIPSPIKRTKTMSTSAREESPMNDTIDEHDGNASTNEVKIMNCIICGKAFHQKSALRDHIETSHMGERLKACPHCSSEFRSQQKYQSHVFNEKCKNANHLCQYPKCNKRFKSVHKMELHMHEKHLSQNDQDSE